jgi:hypothetical protein
MATDAIAALETFVNKNRNSPLAKTAKRAREKNRAANGGSRTARSRASGGSRESQGRPEDGGSHQYCSRAKTAERITPPGTSSRPRIEIANPNYTGVNPPLPVNLGDTYHKVKAIYQTSKTPEPIAKAKAEGKYKGRKPTAYTNPRGARLTGDSRIGKYLIRIGELKEVRHGGSGAIAG